MKWNNIVQLNNLTKRILLSATRMDSIPSFTGIINPIVLDFVPSKVAQLA